MKVSAATLSTLRRRGSSPQEGRLRCCAFTLIEMLVSMVVLVLLVVAVISLTESSIDLWRDNEGRTDACREARAALTVMSRDLGNAVTGTNLSLMKFNLQSGAAGTNYGSNVFFLASLPRSAQEAGSKSDLCEVGFFLALDRTAASTNRTLNLYRYFRSSNQTFSNLISGSLFIGVENGAAAEELLARNVIGMKITPVSSSAGAWIPFVPTEEAPLPEIIEIMLVTVGHAVAGKLEDLDRWRDTNFLLMRQAVQSFTTRVNVGKRP
jgi:prepilin-type N-terminal cleavage/methylation domain-containing protein